MRILLQRLALVILPMCLLFILAATVLGALFTPLTLFEHTLQFCELPCWAGITLNETPSDDASTLLNEQITNAETRIIDFPSSFGFSIQFNGEALIGTVSESFATPGVVGEIYISGDIALISILQVLGTPDCVAPPYDSFFLSSNITPMMSLSWEKGDSQYYFANIFVEQNFEWSAFSRVQGIYLSVFPTCDQPGLYPWLGFAPIWRYFQSQTLPFNFVAP